MKKLLRSRYVGVLLVGCLLSVGGYAKPPQEYKKALEEIDINGAFVGNELEDLTEENLSNFLEAFQGLNENIASLYNAMLNDVQGKLIALDDRTTNLVRRVESYFKVLNESLEAEDIEHAKTILGERVEVLEAILGDVITIADNLIIQLAGIRVHVAVNIFEEARDGQEQMRPDTYITNAGLQWIQSDIDPNENPSDWANAIMPQISAQPEGFVGDYTERLVEVVGQILQTINTLNRIILDDAGNEQLHNFIHFQEAQARVIDDLIQTHQPSIDGQENAIQQMMALQGYATRMYGQLEALINGALAQLQPDEGTDAVEEVETALEVVDIEECHCLPPAQNA